MQTNIVLKILLIFEPSICIIRHNSIVNGQIERSLNNTRCRIAGYPFIYRFLMSTYSVGGPNRANCRMSLSKKIPASATCLFTSDICRENLVFLPSISCRENGGRRYVHACTSSAYICTIK